MTAYPRGSAYLKGTPFDGSACLFWVSCSISDIMRPGEVKAMKGTPTLRSMHRGSIVQLETGKQIPRPRTLKK